MKKLKILFVAMPGAVHTARWIEQISRQNWEIEMFSPFPSSDLTIHHAVPESVLLHLVVRQKRSNVKQTGLWFPFKKGDKFRLLATNFYEIFRNRAERLARLIEKNKPDIVHSLEITGAGYLTLEAKKILAGKNLPFPKWIYSSWGNDIYMYGKILEHKAKIKEVLESIDYLITDCRRDVGLAEKFGFKGELLGIYPTGGGFEISESQKFRQEPVCSRKIIALKGIIRADNQGRAMTALDAFEKCGAKLKNYEIVIYLADEKIIKRAENLSKNSEIKIKIFPPSPHEEFIKLLGKSKISVGLNISDGTPNTMLESMIMGAFPIQSDTVSTAEWIENGVNGFLISPENPDDLARALTNALEDDDLLRKAAEYNIDLTRDRLERDKIRGEVIELYERVAA